MDQWINVKNKLPKFGQLVLAYHNFHDKFCNSQHIIITKFEYQDYWKDGTITHWMPLPSIPNEPGKWISSENEKPKLGQLVLAYHNFEDKFCNELHMIISRFEYQDYWEDGTITHWMPLPDAPNRIK